MNRKNILKLSEETLEISEFNSKNFIKIGQEMTSGQFFEKNVVLYEVYREIFKWELIYGH